MLNCNAQGKRTGLLLGIALLTMVGTAACGSATGDQVVRPTKQGTIALESLKVGIPESSISGAILTFVPDPKGTFGGKVQYLSRTNDALGGQYIAQCRGGRCFGLQVYHLQEPISKDEALKTMHKLLPSNLPLQPPVPEIILEGVDLRNGKPSGPTEVYHFGKTYSGELLYTDKTRSQVAIVNAWLHSQLLESPAASESRSVQAGQTANTVQ